MCFHNALSQSATEIENRFDARFKDKTIFKPIYHGSGFTFMKWPVVTSESPNIIDLYNWGLIPFWIKCQDEANKIKSLTLNAKGETLFIKPSFKFSVNNKRCLVLSSGFFEWQHIGNNKYPHFIYLKNNDLMGMGGVYSEWSNKESGEVFNTFSIITTPANNLMEKIHNTKKRMPLILTKENEKYWLSQDLSPAQITQLIKPLDNNLLAAHTVSRLISSQKHNSNVPEAQKAYEFPELNQLF